MATAVGLEVGGGEASAQRGAQGLAGRVLLVLDTREHLIAAAAAMAEAIMGAGSPPHIRWGSGREHGRLVAQLPG
jgi:predicted ATPase